MVGEGSWSGTGGEMEGVGGAIDIASSFVSDMPISLLEIGDSAIDSFELSCKDLRPTSFLAASSIPAQVFTQNVLNF